MSIDTEHLNGHAPPVRDNRFRPGRGGEMTQEWGDYMLNQWWAARDKKLTFAEALKATALHFMNEPQP